MSLNNSPQSTNPIVVYKNEHGIVAVGADKSCAGELVVDLKKGFDISDHTDEVPKGIDPRAYIARSPALKTSGQGLDPVRSVECLTTLVINCIADILKQEGHLDNFLQHEFLPDWTRSEHANKLDAEQMIAQFREDVGEKNRAIFRFSLLDNTISSHMENVPGYNVPDVPEQAAV